MTDKREIVGCPLDQKTLDRIHRAANDTRVEVETRPLKVDGHELAVIAVPEVRDRIVTTSDGRLLRRVGRDNQPLRGDAFGRFVREREERPGEDEPIANLDYSDLDLTSSIASSGVTADRRYSDELQGH